MRTTWKISMMAGLAALLACGPMEDAELIVMEEEDFGQQEEETEEGLVVAEGGVPGEAILLEEGLPRVHFLEVDGERLMEGDILLDDEQLLAVNADEQELAQAQQAVLTVSKSRRWPNGVIPYTFESGTAAGVKDRTRTAMAAWSANTPIRFVKRTTQSSYVTIRVRTSEFASVGRVGGQQFVTIRGTTSAGVIMHELGHTIGLWHEHTRPDRNQHVKVRWANVKPGMEGAFEIKNAVQRGTYNIGSIMHYSTTTFSRNGKPTLTRADGTLFPSNWRRVTARDASGVTKLYQ